MVQICTLNLQKLLSDCVADQRLCTHLGPIIVRACDGTSVKNELCSTQNVLPQLLIMWNKGSLIIQ